MSAATAIDDLELEAQQTKGRWPKVLALVLVGLIAAGAAAWYFVLSPGDAEAAEGPRDGEVVELEPLTTTTGEATLRHARVSMGVVLAEGVATEVIDSRTALLEDELLAQVSTMEADQLRSAEGSAQLRERLTARAREIWGEEHVRRVVLTELLVQ